MQSKSGKKDLPQVFTDGEFKGLAQDIEDYNEAGELEKFLGIN
jgi:glutaredoxin